MKIALMKSETKDSDPYPTILSQLGHVETISVLEFSFFNLKELSDCITHPEYWDGVIFTSPRAVDAVTKCYFKSIPELWKTLPCYTVGGATARAATSLGFQCLGESTGNGEKLATFIVNHRQSGNLNEAKPLLFVAGVLKRDKLPTILTDNGISFEVLDCYKTLQNPNVDEIIQSYVARNGLPTHIVFFSPSSYKFSYESWKHILSTHLSNVVFVAIGSTTLKSFDDFIQNPLCSKKPSPESLLEVLKQI